MGKEIEIARLTAQYLANRERGRKAKKRRKVIAEDDACLLYDRFYSCISKIRNGEIEESELCEICKERHHLHREVVKLGYANTSVIMKLKHLLKDEIESINTGELWEQSSFDALKETSGALKDDITDKQMDEIRRRAHE